MRLIIGTDDGLYEWNQEYHELLDQLAIEHEYIVIPGVAHNYRQLEEQTSQQTIAFYQQAFAPAYSSSPKQ